MTTAERRAAILQQLAHAGAPLAARTLATHYGVSRQVIVQDLAVIRASHPGIISTARGYVLEQPDQPAGCTREFKVRHTPDRTGQELNLIVDCGGRVKNISISHRGYGRITAGRTCGNFCNRLRTVPPRCCPPPPTATTIIWWRQPPRTG